RPRRRVWAASGAERSRGMTFQANPHASPGSVRLQARSVAADGERSGPLNAPGAAVLDLDQLLRFAVEQGTSDVHVKVGARPRLRLDGHLKQAPFDTVEPV